MCDRREERDTLHVERVVDVFVKNHHDDTVVRCLPHLAKETGMRILLVLDESAYSHRVAQYVSSLLGHRLILGLDSRVAHAPVKPFS